jgi:hypothetical protein
VLFTLPPVRSPPHVHNKQQQEPQLHAHLPRRLNLQRCFNSAPACSAY